MTKPDYSRDAVWGLDNPFSPKDSSKYETVLCKNCGRRASGDAGAQGPACTCKEPEFSSVTIDKGTGLPKEEK